MEGNTDIRTKELFLEREFNIDNIKRLFKNRLCNTLNLHKVSCPLLLERGNGLNDDLNGVERKVSTDLKNGNCDTVEVLNSAAKWKRVALLKYGFDDLEGLVTEMVAIRPDDDIDELHSVVVRQFDWELIINQADYNKDFLMHVVKKIFDIVNTVYRFINQTIFVDEIKFVTTDELKELYPDVESNDEREHLYVKEHRAVFLMQIAHPYRACDYDNWELNGDILLWHEPIQKVLELSSMGIRVDANTLTHQMEIAGHQDRASHMFHSMVLENKLPLTIGGGIGIQRLCMFVLGLTHINQTECGFSGDSLLKFV
ncbi:asparagine synthetase A [Heterosigma akashiwo virus 01]|uniref:Asparagine synthetase A n=1 Tax=Heterosigma akashiwo virus 01 TaxID=97195 RepID=A0A1C9C5F0_HAV01|nr:asparagine synthetase A [Heterosigma akashiwo virus 01]AOM63510.1 asparagine synthetase A [Heterosigma akashiwo virus 01]